MASGGADVNGAPRKSTAQSDVFLPCRACEDLDKRSESGRSDQDGSGPCCASNAALTVANASSARSSVGAVVRRHDARAQQRAAGRDGRVDRDVDEHAGVVERAPQQHGLPVVADDHGHDRRHRVALVLDDLEAALAQPGVQVGGVVEHARQQRRALVGAHDPQRRERRADGRRHAGGGEEERAALHAQVVDDLVAAGEEAAAAREALGERAHPQVDAILDAEQLRGAGAARAEHAGAVRLVDHQPRAEARAQVGDLAAAARRRPPSRRRRRRRRGCRRSSRARLLERALELVDPVVAEGAQLRAAEDAAVEDRGVVAGVGDDGVARRQQRAERREVRLRAGREDERLLGAHPVGDLLLELEVQRDRAVEQARAGQAGAVRRAARRAAPWMTRSSAVRPR